MNLQAEHLLPDNATGDPLSGYLANTRELVTRAIDELLPQDRHSAGLYGLMRDYPLRHGKALRPAICLAACQGEGGALADALPTATVFELYHNAFLIHDDVEDGSLQRRHEPTLHRKCGVPRAVNVGDGMLAIAMTPLLDNTERVGLGRALRVMQLVARMARESAEGQMLELSWVAGEAVPRPGNYMRMVYKKTAWYSFIAPALAGATIGGADKARLHTWRNAMTLLGIAFQIVDDYLNLYGDQRVGKEFEGDLWEGKFSLMLILALERATAEQRRHALTILAKPRASAGGLAARLDKELIDAVSANRIDAALADELRQSMGPTRSAEDVAFLRELLDQYETGEAAMSQARRYAISGSRRLATLIPDASSHWQFIRALFDYVLERKL